MNDKVFTPSSLRRRPMSCLLSASPVASLRYSRSLARALSITSTIARHFALLTRALYHVTMKGGSIAKKVSPLLRLAINRRPTKRAIAFFAYPRVLAATMSQDVMRRKTTPQIYSSRLDTRVINGTTLRTDYALYTSSAGGMLAREVVNFSRIYFIYVTR